MTSPRDRYLAALAQVERHYRTAVSYPGAPESQGEFWEALDTLKGMAGDIPAPPPHEGAAMSATELIGDVARVLAGLQVARSISRTPFGAALEPYDHLNHTLFGIGWHMAGDYEQAIRKVLGLPAVTSVSESGEPGEGS